MSPHARTLLFALRPLAVCLSIIGLSQAKDELRRDRYGDPLPPGAVARLGTLRFRVPGLIKALAFATDGKTLAVSSHAGLYLIDAASGQRIKRLPTLGRSWSPEDKLAFSPDGKQLLSIGPKVGNQGKGVVHLWDLSGEGKLRDYAIEPWLVWVGWSREGQPLAIHVDENGALHLHELSSGRSRCFACDKPSKHPSGVINRNPLLAWSGGTLAVVDAEKTIHVWDTTTGRERCSFHPKTGTIYSLAFSPDGSRLAIRISKAVQMWDAATGKEVYTLNTQQNFGPPHFSADGKTLALADSARTIRVWDAATGKERGHIQDEDGFTTPIAQFALSSDGKWLAAATYSGHSFHVWDVAARKRRAEPVGHQYRPHGIVFLPDGRRLASGGGLDGVIQFWDRGTGEPLMRIHRSGLWLRDIALSSDGRALFSTWTDEKVWISDTTTGERQHIIELNDPDRPDNRQSAISMHLSDDGKRLVAFSYSYPKKGGAGPRYRDTLITGWDTSTHKHLFRRRRPGRESWMALSADARVLAVPFPPIDQIARERAVVMGRPIEQTLRLEDAATGEPLLTFPMRKDPPSPLAVSPDGRLLATYTWQRKAGATTSTVQLWETATAAVALTLTTALDRKVAFSSDGRLLAFTEPAQEIVVWDLMLGREQQRLRGFHAEVTHLAFSPDGRCLVSGLDDATLLVWDIGRRERTANKLDAESVAKAWANFADTDAAHAFRARGKLASTPEQAIPLLRKHLHPAKAADPQRLRRLLADLDSEQFTVREKAQEELVKLGDLAEPALRQTLANKPSLEMRQRVESLLERLRGSVRQPELLQALRAVAVLEDIGTSGAWELLEELTKGAAESRLTREAKASLQRLERRRASK